MIGVLAGTPTDTMMGVTFLSSKGIRATPYAVSDSVDNQQKFLAMPAEEKQKYVENILLSAAESGVTDVMIYCNVLSTAVDVAALRRTTGLHIVTPIDIYRELAGSYRSIGIMAGSGEALAGIEKAIQQENPEAKCWGVSMLEVVFATERGEDPQSIVQRLGINETISLMARYYQAEIVILGCTNFSCLTNLLSEQEGCRVIDPSEKMYEVLCEFAI